jgi:hypothetical protein
MLKVSFQGPKYFSCMGICRKSLLSGAREKVKGLLPGNGRLFRHGKMLKVSLQETGRLFRYGKVKGPLQGIGRLFRHEAM